MKTIVSLLTLTAALSPFGATPVWGQESAESAGAAAVQAAVQKNRDQLRSQLDQEREQLDKAKREVESQTAHIAAVAKSDGGAFADRLVRLVQHGPSATDEPLVIRSSDLDPKDQANLEEDLTVMAHILHKALDDLPGGISHGRAAGIDVFYSPGGSPMRNLYLEGYGALFLLNVNLPLLPPPAKAEAQKEEPPGDSAWEEAKEEIYGSHPDGKATEAVEEFKPEKVDKLKAALLEALKSASNIRGLKSDESVAICVRGGGAGWGGHKPAVKHTSGGGGGSAAAWSWQLLGGPGPSHQTILTIRAKKSDVDDFAKGKLSLEEFRNKTAMTTYVAEAVGGAGGGFGGSGGFGISR